MRYSNSYLFIGFFIFLYSTKLFSQAISIADARLVAENTEVTVVGIAQNGAELGNIRYIYDGTAAIAVYGNAVSTVNRGDQIQVTGKVVNYYYLLEISNITALSTISTGNSIPSPVSLSPSGLSESYESRLVSLSNMSFNAAGQTFVGNQNYIITSSTSETAVIRIGNASPLVGQTIPSGSMTIIGLLSQYSTSNPSSGYQILPRDENDFLYMPASTTNAASNITASTATLNATVNPNGSNTTVSFEYGLTTSYGNTVNAVPPSLTGNTAANVSANISGLTANATYNYRVKATNAVGTTYGANTTFTTSANAPAATTQAATLVSSTGATLNGIVNANGFATSISFEYGTSTAYGNTITATPASLSNSAPTSITATLTGLTPSTTYHFRIKATTSTTTVYGSDMTFNTVNTPTATVQAASNLTASSATLNGVVNANGVTCTVSFEYGTTTAYGSSIAATPASVTGTSNTNVTANITGLNSNTTYYYRIKVLSSAGTIYSLGSNFTTQQAVQADTMVFMQYNLMYYGVIATYAGCDQTTNNSDQKEANLKIICKAAMPTILAVNEMSPSSTYQQRILDYVLNTDGVNYYQKGITTNYCCSSNIVNMIYYDSRKLGYLGQNTVTTSVRDINLHKFYYKAANLSSTHDTAYIIYIQAHLKAGSTTADATARGDAALNLMNYLNSNYKTNYHYFISGDFNVYNSSEAAIDYLTNYTNATIRFYDPVNRMGAWNNNSSFADVHTQSTHSNNVSCFSSGGLDDRFDFILTSANVISGSNKLKYVTGSYKSFGYNGMCYNQSILCSGNTAAPQNVLEALHNMSDHLPVVMKVSINQMAGTEDPIKPAQTYFANIVNPASDELRMLIESTKNQKLTMLLHNMMGTILHNEELQLSIGLQNVAINIEHLPKGLYILQLKSAGGSQSFKVVKQ